MTKSLALGTANRHKVLELRQLLAGAPWRIQSLDDYPAVPPPVEDGDTFEANAVKKARHYASCLSVPCIADDSGISVDALQGAPGVYSARYAGPECSDEDNNTKLLTAMAAIPTPARTARFICCAAYADPDGVVHAEFGVIEGRIGFQPVGSNGFGYDPLFIPEGYENTFAQLTLTEKQSISHRGRAFRKLRAYLETRR